MDENKVDSTMETKNENIFGATDDETMKRNSELKKFTTNIFDLNQECLTKIFENLTFEEFINLASANLLNSKVLYEVFRDNNKLPHPYEEAIKEHFKQFDYANLIHNTPASIQYEREVFGMFGSLISKVGLYYDHRNYRYNGALDKIILDYGMNLEEIGLYNADANTFDTIQRRFVNVTDLVFEDGFVGRTFLNLKKWFPNLLTLTMIDAKIWDCSFFQQKLRYLVKFSMKNPSCFCFCCSKFSNVLSDPSLHMATNDHLKQFLRANPQIQHLTISHDKEDVIYSEAGQELSMRINSDLLQFIENHLKLLRYLNVDITLSRKRFVPPVELTTFRNLETLIIKASQPKHLAKLNIEAQKLNNLRFDLQLNLTGPRCNLMIHKHSVELSLKENASRMKTKIYTCTNREMPTRATFYHLFAYTIHHLINRQPAPVRRITDTTYQK
ncbi:hypothetical protein Bhyg_08535, partial [Pseudolycoriella hygida]